MQEMRAMGNALHGHPAQMIAKDMVRLALAAALPYAESAVRHVAIDAPPP